MNLDAVQLVASFRVALRQREARQDDPDSVQRFAQAYQQLTEFARHADRAEQDRLLYALAEPMTAKESNWEFGCIANTCGTIVECGGDPGIAIEPILDRLTGQIERVPDFVELMQTHLGVEHPNRVTEDDWPTLGREHPEHAWVIGEWYALRFTGCAAMAMLCRDVEARKRARGRIDLIQRAEAARSDNPYAYYLAEVLGMVDDEQVLVLDVPRRLGFRVHLTALRNNFHFFTLLQDALLSHPTANDWPGPRPRPLVVALARSERMLPDISPNEWAADPHGENDTALWTYCTWPALKADETLQTMEESKPHLPPWVWGEGKPTDILLVAGERVVLLGPLEMPRSWSLGFFPPLHPALRSAVRVEAMLNAAEYADWMRKIKRI